MKTLLFAILATLALGIWGSFGLCKHAIEMLDAAKEDAQAIKPALENGSQVIAKVNEAADAQVKSSAALERDVRAEMWHLDRTLTTLDQTVTNYGTIPAHLNGIADAASETARHASDDLATLNVSLLSVGPLVSHSDAAVTDLDALLKDEALHQTMINVDLTTGNVAAITGDLQKVSDKLTNDFVAPKPWYRKIGPSLSDLWDYGALVARHTP